MCQRRINVMNLPPRRRHFPLPRWWLFSSAAEQWKEKNAMRQKGRKNEHKEDVGGTRHN